MKTTLRTLSVRARGRDRHGCTAAGGVVFTQRAIDDQRVAAERQAEHRKLGLQIADESDLLTNEARALVVTGDRRHERRYWTAIEKTKSGDRALARLKELGSAPTSSPSIALAKKNSNDLVATETRAMRLVNDALGVPTSEMHPAIAAWKPSVADRALTADEKMATARRIMFDRKYNANVAIIKEPIARFQRAMDARLVERGGRRRAAGRTCDHAAHRPRRPPDRRPGRAGLDRPAHRSASRADRRRRRRHRGRRGRPARDVRGRDEIADMGGAMQRTIAYLQDMTGHAQRIASGDLSIDVAAEVRT